VEVCAFITLCVHNPYLLALQTLHAIGVRFHIFCSCHCHLFVLEERTGIVSDFVHVEGFGHTVRNAAIRTDVVQFDLHFVDAVIYYCRVGGQCAWILCCGKILGHEHVSVAVRVYMRWESNLHYRNTEIVEPYLAGVRHTRLM